MAKPEQHDFSARYGGRYLVIQVFVNTDEDHNKVVRRVTNAARGIKLNAVMATVAVHKAGTESEAAWGEIAKISAEAHANPNVKPWDTTKDE